MKTTMILAFLLLSLATQAQKLVMDETYLTKKADHYELVTYNAQLNESIAKRASFYKQDAVGGKHRYFIVLRNGNLLNRFFTKMNK